MSDFSYSHLHSPSLPPLFCWCWLKSQIHLSTEIKDKQLCISNNIFILLIIRRPQDHNCSAGSECSRFTGVTVFHSLPDNHVCHLNGIGRLSAGVSKAAEWKSHFLSELLKLMWDPLWGRSSLWSKVKQWADSWISLLANISISNLCPYLAIRMHIWQFHCQSVIFFPLIPRKDYLINN